MGDKLLLAAVVFGLVSAGPSAARELPAARISDREALQAWESVFGMYRADYGHYPELSDIQAAAALARAEDYWVDPQTTDASGRPYLVVSRPGAFQVSTADGRLVRNGRRTVAKRPPAPVRVVQHTSSSISSSSTSPVALALRQITMMPTMLGAAIAVESI